MQWSLHNCLGWCENKERNSEWWKIQMMERVGEVFAIGGGNNDMIILQYKWSQVVDRKIQILKIERGQLQLVWGGGRLSLFAPRGCSASPTGCVLRSQAIGSLQYHNINGDHLIKILRIRSGNCSHQSHNVSLMQNDVCTCKLMDD